jgi:hypothetical protein
MHNSSMAEKNAGNFTESASFCEFSCAAEQGIFSGEQGINSAFSTGAGIWREIHPYAQPRQRSALADKIIINESIKLKRARSPMPQGELP